MKMTTAEFQSQRLLAREMGITEGSTWLHYKGGIYVVDRFGICTVRGVFAVIYHRVAGNDFDARAEDGIGYIRPAVEWMQIVDHRIGMTRFNKIDD